MTSANLQGYHAINLYYEDTDLSGFVYHANYLKYFERAREHLIGIDYLKNLYTSGLHFVVSKAELSYRAPAMHGDTLEIESTGTYSKSPAIPFTQQAWVNKEGSRLLVVEAAITIVALNKSNRPIRLPDETIKYFASRCAGRLVSQPAQ